MRAIALGVALCGCHPPTPAIVEPTAMTEPARDVAAILAASDLPDELPTPIDGDPMAVTVHRLSNGMTVYVSPDPTQPRVAAWIGVRAGARHDPPRSTGLAHYLEHMLFKGSDEIGTIDLAREREHLDAIAELYRRLAATESTTERAEILAQIDAATVASAASVVPNEMERLYGALGIVGINAFTTYDETVYHANVPPHQIATWARIEAERFDDPVFRLFFPELESVYEEKNLSLDDPVDIVSEAQGEALFPRHAYGQQTILGEVEHLRTPAFADMLAFFERWYVPNNMAIVLVGDVNATEVVPVLEAAFGRLEPRALPTRPPGEVVPLEGRVERIVDAPGEQGVSLTWLTVPATHEDHTKLEVLERVLDNGSTGLVDLELELTQALPSAGAYLSGMVEAGYLELYATAREDQTLAEAEALLLDVMADLKRGEVTQQDVDAVQLQLEIDEAYALEDPETRAEIIMDSFVRRMQWRDVVERKRARKAVDREAVIEVARKYVGPSFVAVHRRDGQPKRERLAQPKVTPIAIDPARRSAFAADVLANASKPPPPRFLRAGKDFVEAELSTGPLIATRNDRNDLFTVTYHFERGSRAVPMLCFGLSLFELSGRARQPAAELQRELYRLGAVVDTECDLDSVDVHVFGIDRNFEATLALVHAWLSGPKADPAVLAGVIANELSDREDTMQDPHWIGVALRDYARFGEASPWLLVPSNRALKDARAKPLLALVSDLARWQRHTLYYGPRSIEQIRDVVPWGEGNRVPPAVPRRALVHPDAPRVLAVHQDTSKASGWVVFARPPLPAQDRPSALLFEHYLDGDSTALVYQQLREARGLVYSSAASYNMPTRVGDDCELRGSFATGNDKLVAAANVLLELMRAPPDRDRFRESRATLQSRFRIDRTDPRSVPYAVLAWRLAGFDHDVREDDWAGISKVEMSAVATFAQEQVGGAPTFAVVGDLDRIGREALARLGRVTQIKPQDLFGYRLSRARVAG